MEDELAINGGEEMLYIGNHLNANLVKEEDAGAKGDEAKCTCIRMISQYHRLYSIL